MTVRRIRRYGDPVLRTPAAPIETIDDSVRQLVRDLLDTVDMEGRAGVAAPQIGVSLAAFSYNVDGRIGYLLNPEVVELGGELVDVDEGCLSVPSLWFKAPRREFARARGIDLEGKTVELSGTGVFAQMLQHETDHLAGTVFVDILPKDRRREALREIRRSDWF